MALLALLAAPDTQAQQFDETQVGRTFIVAFPDTVGNLSDPRHPSPLRDTFAIYIYSTVDNACTITGDGGYRREVELKAGAFTTVWLDDAAHPSSDITVREVGAVSRSTFRIEARSRSRGHPPGPSRIVSLAKLSLGPKAPSPRPQAVSPREATPYLTPIATPMPP